MGASPAGDFAFPPIYHFPPFWTPQPTLSTRRAQLRKWSSLILSYCQHQRLLRLSLTDALQTPLFHNKELKKRLTLAEAREIIEWMCREEGGKQAEWVAGGKEGGKEVCWIWWRGVEEWAEMVAGWVEETGQKGTVLTLYEITEGEGTMGQGTFCSTVSKACGWLGQWVC